MIPDFTKALFQQALDEWGKYVDKFKTLPRQEQDAFLKNAGFASQHDILAHVAVWWEEARRIIRQLVDQPGFSPPKYDFDEFNAAALRRFKATPEAEFLAWYEIERQQMRTLISSLTGPEFAIPRVQSWLNGVTLEHLKEHGLDAPRFLTLDMLQREWAGYLEGFNEFPPDKQKSFLIKQGFARFRDLAAHIIAWWEDGLAVIDAISKNPEYSPQSKDTDFYNADAIELFGKLSEVDIWKKFESTRQSLIELVINLPEQTFNHKHVQAWLKSDVIEHYFDHAL